MSARNPKEAPVSNGPAQEAVKTADLRGTVATLARGAGWAVLDLVAYNAGQASRPTLLLVRGEHLYVYVIGDRAELSAKQNEWVGWVRAAGAEVLVARPSTIGDLFERLNRPAPTD